MWFPTNIVSGTRVPTCSLCQKSRCFSMLTQFWYAICWICNQRPTSCSHCLLSQLITKPTTSYSNTCLHLPPMLPLKHQPEPQLTSFALDFGHLGHLVLGIGTPSASAMLLSQVHGFLTPHLEFDYSCAWARTKKHVTPQLCTARSVSPPQTLPEKSYALRSCFLLFLPFHLMVNGRYNIFQNTAHICSILVVLYYTIIKYCIPIIFPWNIPLLMIKFNYHPCISPLCPGNYSVYIWGNYHISLTWIVRPFGDDFPY